MELSTTYYRLKSFFSIAEIISSRLAIQFDRACALAKKSGSNVYYSVLFYHDDMPYVCSIDVNAKFSQRMVYKISKTTDGFEVLTYHRESRTYFLFSGHFMQRYAERFDLQHLKSAEIVKHFADNNPVLVLSKKAERKKDKKIFTAMCNMGLMHCVQENGCNLITFDTILGHSQLNTGQLKKQTGLGKKFAHVSKVIYPQGNKAA